MHITQYLHAQYKSNSKERHSYTAVDHKTVGKSMKYTDYSL